MRLVFVGGTGPVGTAAVRIALAAGHDVVVAHRGEHELPDDIDVRHLHGEREALLAPDGPIANARADVLVDTRTTAENAAALVACARAAGARRLVVVSSTDVYESFVSGSGFDVAGGRAVLPTQTLPIAEDAPLRTAPYPWAPPGHDNAAMERALREARRDEAIAVLRPGMIYGPGAAGREWTIVARIRAGIRRIELPDGGVQLFGRAAVERVGRAVVAAAERAPDALWPVNVVDPYGWTYAGLVREIGRLRGWEWEPVAVRWEEADHPFKLQSPFVFSDVRLREVLGVTEPDPRAALAETVRWLWDHGAERYGDGMEPSVPTHRGPERATVATPDAWTELNDRMIERAKASGAIRAPEIEAAFRATPRHLLLPGVRPETVYGGGAVMTRSDADGRPISSSSEVAIMGLMLEALNAQPGHRVLEIGAGTGYNAALLDHLVGPEGQVTSIELDPDIAAEARANLARAGHTPVSVVVADGHDGLSDAAPYDRIIATASVSDVPRAWLDQLVEGGLLTVPPRLRAGAQMVVTFRRRSDRLESVAVVAGGFMPLRGDHDATGPTLSIAGDWEATLPSARDGDAEAIADLLRTEPSVEPSRGVPWQVTFSLAGLVEPDWIELRQRERPTTWQGVYDREANGLALVWPIPIPMGTGRSTLLAYGAPRARERLLRLVERLTAVGVDRVRIEASPKEQPAPSGQIVIEGGSFRYGLSWRSDPDAGSPGSPKAAS